MARDLTGDTVELLQTLIRNECVNDGSPDSGQEVRNADVLQSVLEGAGVAVERYEPTPGRVSIVARVEGTDRSAPSLCLMGHTDVVPVHPEGWVNDPFEGELIDGEVWGRGAVDMLNLTASMAVAFRGLADSGFRPRGDLIYFGVADEEAGSAHGARWMADNHPDAIRADYVLTENGGLHSGPEAAPYVGVNVAEKGVAWRRLTVRGVPGHGSMPFRKDNALVKAAGVVQRLAEYRPAPRFSELWTTRVETLGLPDELREALLDPARIDEALGQLPSVPAAAHLHACTHTTFSPNIAHGGTKVNVIPDRVDIDVDIRSLPGIESHEVEAMIKEALGPLASRVTIDTPPDRKRGGSVSPTDTPLMATISRVTKRMMPDSRVVPAITTGGTDAKFFRWKGIPSYGFGLHSLRIPYTEYPVMFHGHNERIDTESLKLSAEMWETLAREFLS
jgi:acetylornithine deacetylase/succinyl-diaminopimelate desuccinylase-like protein